MVIQQLEKPFENAEFNHCKTYLLIGLPRCYLHEIRQPELRMFWVCHITGGGYEDNLVRVLPQTLVIKRKIFTPE